MAGFVTALQPLDPVPVVDQHAVVTSFALTVDAAKALDVEDVPAHVAVDLSNARRL
jgi:hypothetical protein